ncbi:MAG: hypothetical protein ACJAVU_001316 [Cognaticolwellia sp.]|jgi:hypothetical protein
MNVYSCEKGFVVEIFRAEFKSLYHRNFWKNSLLLKGSTLFAICELSFYRVVCTLKMIIPKIYFYIMNI